MRFALAVVKLFPWGGVQRDCLRFARALQDRGHEVTIFTSSAEGALPADIGIEILPARALTNHGRNRRFSDALVRAVRGRYQCVVGFDKLSGLDVLYCVDPSVSARAHVPFFGAGFRAIVRCWRSKRRRSSRSLAPASLGYRRLYSMNTGTRGARPSSDLLCCRRISTRRGGARICEPTAPASEYAAHSVFPMNLPCFRSACSRK